MAQKRGPRLRGQRLLDNAPCQAAVSLDSGALPFPDIVLCSSSIDLTDMPRALPLGELARSA